mmetsp:Transcript_90556/g.189406  ORF Transcript_90556/g.189406 Transcript_90556/m.189406 type:complete len:88 (-) Transcript_90556:368-631(-)
MLLAVEPNADRPSSREVVGVFVLDMYWLWAVAEPPPSFLLESDRAVTVGEDSSQREGVPAGMPINPEEAGSRLLRDIGDPKTALAWI